MVLRFLLPVLFLFVCNLDPSSSAGHLIRCRRGKYRTDKVTAIKLGYCWKFMNHNFSHDSAFDQCNRFSARLPAVNTPSKARKLSKFIAASIKLYASGEMGTHYRTVYEKGWPAGDEFWLSDIVNGNWNSTEMPASTTLAEQPAGRKHGRQCILFNYQKSTWRYISCGIIGGRHPTICEEKEHMYADDVGAGDMTTPSVTLPPTPAPLQGATFTCPDGYKIFENYCFYLTNGRLSITDAEKTCKDSGGRQTWISESTKNSVVTRYLQANKNNPGFVDGVWLSRLEGNGYIIKWKSSGTNARYLVNKNNLYSTHLMKGVEPKLLMFSDGRVSHCKVRCLKYQALCEADGIWKVWNKLDDQHQKNIPGGITAPPIVVAPPEKYEESENQEENDYYDDEYDNDYPPEDEKFDPDSILTRGPK